MLYVVTPTRCFCECHTEGVYEFGQVAAPSVARVDPIAAVTACDTCLGAHAVVFSGRPPASSSGGRRWNPPPLVVPVEPEAGPAESGYGE